MIDWQPTRLPGVLRRNLQEHADSRGAFRELWRRSWTEGLVSAPFAQANLSRSRAGVLRGMHFHRRQMDLWIVASGRALAVAADLRAVAAGGAADHVPAVELHELGAGDALLLPELVAHGFYAHTDLDLIYLVTAEYDSTDEHGFAWDDPSAAIAWPETDPILSDRDRSNPLLRDAIARLQGQSDSA